MSLTGIDPTDPTPSDRRELIFGAGQSLGAGGPRYVMLYGNKTSAGSETVETIGTPVLNDQDARDRMGARSELYQEYRVYAAVDPDATIYFIPVTEAGGGTAATQTHTFATAATDSTTADIFWGGRQTSFPVASGDSVTTQAAAAKAAINSADQGSWPMTADNLAGVLTLTSANVGDRGDYSIQNVRIVHRKSVGTTVTKAAITSGTGTDDFTTAFATVIAAGRYYYQVSPKYGTSGPTATDNGIGEHILNINTQALPINGRGQQVIFGLIGTQANCTTVTTDSDVNAVRARFFHAKNSDYTPGMIAAHCAAVMRRAQTKHPAASLIGYTNSDSTPFQIPAPFAKSDYLTAAEIKADLNNGTCPIEFSATGTGKIVREVTSKSLVPGTTINDYRCRSGHIVSAIDFYWDTLADLYTANKQPFAANDPPKGRAPLPNVQYPRDTAALAASLIDDFCGPNPLGLYNGPILDPDFQQAMKDSIVAAPLSTGGISVRIDLKAVKLNVKSEWEIREVSAAQ